MLPTSNGMKYFIAHLLSGDAKKYHEKLTRTLSRRFSVVPLHEKVPPHMTVKIPFEASDDEIRDVERVLRSFARTRAAEPFFISGFGHFGFRTIYLNVEKSERTVALARGCLSAMKKNLPWLSFGPLEGNKLHASIARFLSRRQFLRIWKLLGGLKPSFQSTFDNIAILKKDGSHWDIHTRIALTGRTDMSNSKPYAPSVSRQKTLVS